MQTSNFGVKKNNGSNGSKMYSNQCMWLSILDYLNDVLGNNLSLEEIRTIGSRNNTTINNELEQFDTTLHYESLLNVIETFYLQIHFYVVFRDGEHQFISDIPNMISGNLSSPNIVSIVSYGAHYELITFIKNKLLYGGKIKNNDIFIPDRDLALGKKINNENKLNIEQIKRIDDLIDICVNFNRVILYMEYDITIKKSKLMDFDKSFVTNNKNIDLLDEETHVVIISSFQEHKIFLEKDINNAKSELDNIKSNYEIVKKELYELISD